MSSRWLAFDIGCIECRESSRVIGTYDTKGEAEAATAAAEEARAQDWHGEHHFEVYDLEAEA